MKKLLMGTTAICGLGTLGADPTAADGIQLRLGGYQYVLFSVGAINEGSGFPDADFNPTGLWNDGEVWFLGESQLDNGIEFGFNAQLEINNSPDRIDEAYIYVESDFGRIVAGSENTAAYIMHYAAPNVGLVINSGWQTVFVPAPDGIGQLTRRPGGSTFLDSGNDEASLTYYTPRIEGFQLGLTYQPTIFNNGAGYGASNAGPVEANEETQYRNGFAAGVNFVESFDGISIAGAAGYRRSVASDVVARNGFDNYQSVSLGGNISYAGVTVGGSYANSIDGQVFGSSPGSFSSDEGHAWDAGISYAAGPWAVGGSFILGSVENSVADPGQQVVRTAQVGATYALGPGIDLLGGVMWVNYNTEDRRTTSGVVAAGGLNFSF